MRTKREIKKEIEQWGKLCDNYESLADSMLVTALAFYDKDKRSDKFKAAIELLESVKAPLTGEQMLNSIKMDLESHERIKNEAKIALRTLTWVSEDPKKIDKPE